MVVDYKKIIRSRKLRKKILDFLLFIPDKMMLQLQYRIKTGRRLDLKKPQRYTEKLQWYKMNYRNPEMKRCVDKLAVREYVKEKGLEYILVKLLAVYNDFQEIDWEQLPPNFILKTTTGSGGNNVMVCHEKKQLREKIKQMGDTLNTKESLTSGREWAYYNIPSKIIAEELLVDEKKPEAGIKDYKIFCFSGKPEYIVVDTDRYSQHKRNFYDINWKKLNISSDCPVTKEIDKKPENIDEMLKIAEKLSKDFPFVRVDLYNVGGKIYFGELTFYPWSGYVQFTPDEFDFILGENFELIRYQKNDREEKNR